MCACVCICVCVRMYVCMCVSESKHQQCMYDVYWILWIFVQLTHVYEEWVLLSIQRYIVYAFMSAFDMRGALCKSQSKLSF